MKIILSTMIICSLLSVFYSCKSNPIVPPAEDQPGRRDYTWEVDTIKIFSNYIHSIWGSSPDDIWGVGPGGALNTTIWHYDGNEWTTDGVGRNLSPYCVYGFSKNDVWIGGQNGKLWHFDGNEWSQNYKHTIDGFEGIDLYDIYGTSNRDIYAVGTVWFTNEIRRGIILHYDGYKWEQKYLADFNSYFYKVKSTSTKGCFIHCLKQDVINYGTDTTLFYNFNGKDFIEIYTDKNKNIKQGGISIIDDNAYFSFGNVIYIYHGNNFNEIFKMPSFKLYSPSILGGRNKLDIFLGTSEGVEHYNGSDIVLLLKTHSWPDDAVLFTKDVFFLNATFENGETLIYHGKLKEL